MPKKSVTRKAQGEGTIRQRSNGKWEGRYTVGRDPGTGKQIQKSIYGNSQKEVRQRLQQISLSIDSGDYFEPTKIDVGTWLDTWLDQYTNNLKEHTHVSYETQIRVHIKPALGAVRLSKLHPDKIQLFYNGLLNRENPLSAKTIKNINGVLHHALERAVTLGYIRQNPCVGVTLPRITKADIHPLTESEMHLFIEACRGNEYELLFLVDMFTGMRQSEIIGLTWDRINMDAGTILVDRQLVYVKKGNGLYKYTSLKNDTPRKLTVAPTVISLLQDQQLRQEKRKENSKKAWNDSEFPGLVFTNEIGGHYCHNSLEHNFKRIVARIGAPSCRFHDLRHTYAVNSLRAGDDIKTVQSNLGHATAAFTLDRYVHYTDDMRKDSANHMESFIRGILET